MAVATSVAIVVAVLIAACVAVASLVAVDVDAVVAAVVAVAVDAAAVVAVDVDVDAVVVVWLVLAEEVVVLVGVFDDPPQAASASVNMTTLVETNRLPRSSCGRVKRGSCNGSPLLFERNVAASWSRNDRD